MEEIENSGCLPAIFEQDSNGTYIIRIANIDGCMSWADTLEDALINIREALNLHLKGMRKDSIPIPPFSVSAIQENLNPSETLIMLELY